MDSPNAVVADIFSRHAENAEAAGDFVGRSNTDLANECYSLAERLREFSKQWNNRKE